MEIFYLIAEIAANFIEALVGYKFSCFILNRNYQSRLLYGLAGIQAIGLYFFQKEELFSNYLVFMFALLLAILISCFYKVKFSVSLAASATYAVHIMALTELSSLVILGVFSRQEFIGNIMVAGHSVIRSVYILTIKLVQVLVYLAVKHVIKERAHVCKVLMEHWKIILLLNAGSYVCILLLIYYIVIEITSDIVINWLSYIIFCILCSILFVFYLRLRKDAERRELIEIKNKILEQNYDGLKQVLDTQAKSAHDLKNHLNILYKYMDDKDTESAKAYIEKIRQPFLTSDAEHWTGNEIIDFILNTKSAEARKNGVTMHIDTNIHKIKISDRDINSLLSNILDNAIEAAAKGKENEKVVDIWMKTIHDMWIIKVKNTYASPIHKKGESFLTSKADKKMHGIGLEIIKDIVRKYDGSFKVDYDEKIFQILIELPFETSEA